MNKITILCSNYNSERWIDEYLQYLNNQTISGFDIVFADAKSTDNSLSKIKNFNFNNKINAKIIELPTRIGIYPTWNILINEVKTDYMMNYNTDDMLFDGALEVYRKALEDNPDADIIYGPCGFVRSRNPKEFVGYGNWPEYSHEILCRMCICGPFPLLKTASIKKAGYFDESFVSSGDYEMWLRMSKMGYKFKRIPELIGSFYFRDDSIHMINQSKASEEDRLIQNKYR